MTGNAPAVDALLNPRSIAILGASDDSTRIGGRPIRYMRAGGYSGAIYPVNPKRRKVQGLSAFADVRDVPGEVDFALIALPAPLVVEAARAAAAKGVKGCLVFSSGFAEAGAEGAGLQADLAAVARETGMRIVGPNCLGLFNTALGFYPTFTSALDDNLPEPGPLSIVSQSGAFGSHLSYLAKERGIGLRYWITTGNECDVQVAECIGWLADDPETKIIIAYAEGVKDGGRLIEGLDRARRNRKPVVFMKVGRSEVGAEAASSHTASLAGSDTVYDAVLRQFGAHRVRTTEEMLDIAYAASRGIFPQGRRIGLVTISGGAGVMMADAAADHGLDVAPMPAPAQRALKEEILPYASVRNPVDITAQAFNDLSLVSRNLQIMLGQGGYDAIVAFFTAVASAPMIAAPVREALHRGLQGHEDTLVALSMLGPPEIKRLYEREGLLLFEDPSRAIAAIAALCGFAERFAAARRAAPRPAAPALPPLPDRPIDERQAKALLREFGIPTVPDRLATSPEEAEAAARAFGCRVALKIASPDILHKTEVGGVRLDVPVEAAADAYRAVVEGVAARAPRARLDGVLVSPMVEGGVETILGVRRDPVFGPMVMFGLGGVFVEVLQDVTFRVAPFGVDEARAMIREIRGRAVLRGARGQPPVDVAALAAALAKLSLFAAAHAEEIDEGQGAIALDAAIVPRAAARMRSPA
jgi:acyl-CoA synthetase (NDP forming)